MRNRAVLFARPRSPQDEDDGFEREERVLEALDAEAQWIDLELVADGRAEVACADLPERRTWIYRGWMLPQESYDELDLALREQGSRLWVSPEQYARASFVPRWAPALGDATPRTVWTDDDDVDDAWEAALTLGAGPWIVKDHLQSVKEDWTGACFVPAEVSRERFTAIVRAMIEARGEHFEGGIVVRAYEAPRELPFRMPERAVPDEHRVFVVRREVVAHAPYHDVDAAPLSRTELDFVASRARAIRSPFFAIDVLRTADGRTRLLEVNDGGVARLPVDLDACALYEALLDRGR